MVWSRGRQRLFDKEFKDTQSEWLQPKNDGASSRKRKAKGCKNPTVKAHRNTGRQVTRKCQASAPRIAINGLRGRRSIRLYLRPGLGPDFLLRRRLTIFKHWRWSRMGEDKSKLPKIHTVAYGADAAGAAFLQALAREFPGRYKKINGLAPPVIFKVDEARRTVCCRKSPARFVRSFHQPICSRIPLPSDAD
jgi:hypothetical protein